MLKNGKMMKCCNILVTITAVLTFGSIATAYPTHNTRTGIVEVIAGNGSLVAADKLLCADENTVKARPLYQRNQMIEMGVLFSPGFMERINVNAHSRFTDTSVRFNLAGGGSLSIAINLKGPVKIRYSIRF